MKPHRRLAAVLAVGMLAVAGCAQLTPTVPSGHPAAESAPLGTPGTGGSGTFSPSAGAPDSPAAPSSSTPPPVQVSTSAKAVKADLGVDVYWHTEGSRSAVTAQANKVLDYVVGLNANSVALAFPIFTDGPRPTRVYAVSGDTPDPATLGIVIAAAKARGLRVMLRPVIDETNISPSGNWRGTIQPVSRTTWFANYRALIDPYLDLAQTAHADEFVVGVELNSLMGDTAQWQAVESDAAARFDGQISYADNFDVWVTADSPSAIPAIGLDAYPPFQLSDSATVSQLSAAWTTWLRHRSTTTLQKTAIQELGIPAESGAYKHPASWGGQSTIDTKVQANWFAAACQSARSLGMRGLYFWMVDSNADPGNAGGYPSGSFIGRGDTAIKACFSDAWTHA